MFITYKELWFIFKVALLAIVIKIPGGFLGDFALKTFELNDPLYSSDLQLPELEFVSVFFATVVAPIVETLVGQLLPILLISKLTKDNRFKVLFSAVVFAAWHLPVVGFLPSAFLVGLVLAWAYVQRLKYGKAYAFVITTLIHSLHNLLAFLLFAALSLLE